MAVETFPRPAASALDRTVDLARVRWEIIAYIAIVALSVVAHLWGLDRMAMHHDESIHAWSSWRLYTGAGGFSCWSGLDENGNPRGGVSAPTYCYDPVYHGPSLYFLTAFSYFLFGDGDAQARLPMAVAGILMVASCWWLRPYLGTRGALAAAVLLGFSPSLLYYTRFARHDGLMVLWEVWMVVGVFRWLDTGRSRWLYLLAAALALAIGTHELYYILFFIFGIFVLMRLLAESRFARYLNIGLLAVIGLCVLLMVINAPLPFGRGLYLGEKAFLVASALLLAWLCQRLWDPRPILTSRLRQLWFEDRPTLWIALSILGGLYLVQYTTFFAYPRGAIDGLYAGLAYWLGSQQEYARGDQPWYYYLMQLPLYDPIAVVAGIGMVVAMIATLARRWVMARRGAVAAAPGGAPAPASAADPAPATEEADPAVEPQRAAPSLDPAFIGDHASITVDAPSSPAVRPSPPPWQLFPLLMVFWFFSAVIIFSWAGEKMPWLLVHMSLPGNLLAAWVIARLLAFSGLGDRAAAGDDAEAPPDLRNAPAPGAIAWLVPVTTLLALVALGVAYWRFTLGGDGQSGQVNLLQGILPLLIAGGMIYALLTLAGYLGGRAVLAIAALSCVALLGAYTLRATWMAVYAHPDVPIEPLVYTQSAPDVPRIAADIRELAVNLTRNQRTPEDETGGLSMPLILDGGDAGGEGSLAWPLQWYFRDFRCIAWTKRDVYENNPTLASFEVNLPNCTPAQAPMVLLYKPHVTDQVRSVLSEGYVQPYGETSIFNWWFPEGDKCSPQSPGYKRFYFSSWTSAEELGSDPASGSAGECGRDISADVNGPLAPILWPLLPENWGWMQKFLIYRELPAPLVPGAREMEVWLRSDLAGGFGEASAGGTGAPQLRLVAQQSISLPEGATNPTGAVIDGQGNVYISDTTSHQVHIFSPDGTLLRSIGGLGSDLGKFYEPRGLAVDNQGNLYVADTWNARIVKYDPTGRPVASWGSGSQDLGDGRKATITEGTPEANQANPLGFFGPRGLAVDAQGNVYIADTGNKRIVVTDAEGNFRYQWGYAGAELGAFNEPTGVAVDAQGNVYVADTWNGRVQVFAPDGSGQVSPIPIVTWNVGGWRPNTYDDPSIAASPDGTVYVSVPSRQQVLAANLRGDLLLRWGGAGEDLASLNSPSGMAPAPDGSLWVVDRARAQLLRFVLPQVQPDSVTR